jgi:outer membrane protein OmpA-like peptidoglycan-associated protein
VEFEPMNSFRLITVVGLAGLLAACATPYEVADVNAIRTAEASGGTPFASELFNAYKAEAVYEADAETEWDHAAIYARKGLRVSAGEAVLPEDLATSEWQVPADRLPEVGDARARLMGYFGNGARERVPAAAAKAQAKFDCWMEEEAEGDSSSDCRTAFLKIEPELQVKPAAAAPAPAALKVVKTFIVYFDFAKAKLTNTAKKTLHDVAVAQSEIHPVNIIVSGHTDTVGKAGPNDKLSQKRAKNVVDFLAKLGVKAEAITSKAFGKTKPAVTTADNVKEAKNRRVEIYFEK